MNVGQSEIASLESVGELCVINAQAMQYRSVQVVDMHGILFDVVTEFVGGTLGNTIWEL